MGQGVAADFGQGSGEFDSGGSAADDHKIKRFAGDPPADGLAFGQFEGQQNAAADFERVFDGLEAGSESFPFVVAEIGVAGAGGDDQGIVRNFLASFSAASAPRGVRGRSP